MDRTQAFAEYGRILQESADWLSHGYRRKHADREPTLPILWVTPDETPPPMSENQPLTPSTDLGVPPAAVNVSVVESTPAEGTPFGGATLQQIAGEVAGCRNCNLYLIRQSTVPGIGSIGATLMVVTAPPVVGAGETDNPLPLYEIEYLDRWLTALELKTGRDTFITPAVKCRTPGGRPPHPEESGACAGYLRRQYKEVKPRAILALGAAACGALTGNQADFPSLVGRDWTWGAIPALVLWTPAEVLANPGRLRKPVWESLQRLKAAWNAVPGSYV